MTKNEEQTFWLLKILIENIVPSYHSNTMSGLIIDIAVLEKLLNLRVPEIMDRLNDFGRFFCRFLAQYCQKIMHLNCVQDYHVPL